MMRNVAVAFICCATAPALAAEIQPTFQATWDWVSRDPDCIPADYPDFVMFTCNKEMTLWYFTKASNAAHPGVVKRSVVADQDGGVSAHEDGRSFGPNEAQPAFKAWMGSIVALDEQVRQELKARHDAGTKP